MLKKSTAVLIMENGDPSLVVVDYATYKGLLGEGNEAPKTASPAALVAPKPGLTPGETELLERINKDILALKEQIAEEEKALEVG